MKRSFLTIFPLILICLSFILVDAGVFHRVIDKRSVIHDGVLGGPFWIIEVDGKPTQRVEHGFLVTRVPLALVAPGQRTFKLAASSQPLSTDRVITFETTVDVGTDYILEARATGEPLLHPRSTGQN